MANYTQTDKGDWHIAIGAEGSKARLKIEYPSLLEDLAKLRNETAGTGTQIAISKIKAKGIVRPMIIVNLLEISNFYI